MTVENFAYNNYELTQAVQSKIDPDVTRQEVTGFNCPRCKRVNAPLHHGEAVICQCDLAMCLYGNGLTCATGGIDELRDDIGPHPMSILRPIEASG